MILQFLGTGTSQGIPVINCKCEVCSSQNPKDKRLRSSVFINKGNTGILIDAGPDLRQQALTQQILHLDAVLLTHNHADHTAGIDDLRPFHFKNRKPMDLYAESWVLDDITKRFHYAFHSEPYPGAIQLELHPLVPNMEFEIGEFNILPLRIFHGELPIIGYKIGELVYLTDVKTIPPETLEAIVNCKVLVINTLRLQKHHSHLNLEEALHYINIIKPSRTFLTHISHHLGLHDEIAQELDQNIQPAYDSLTIEL